MRRLLKFIFVSFIVFGYAIPILAQDRYDENETSVNLFRNPSIGIENRVDQISMHIGFYPTVISKNKEGKNESTSFIKVGMSFWYLPWGDKLIPSSLFFTFSFVHGLSKSYKGRNGFIVETGSRVMLDDHFNFRLGIALLKAKEHPWKLNPTPGLSYSFMEK
ncbi:MAG: hypothetical protein ACKVQV_14795 [Bacteroidia bacterium]